MSGDSAVTRVLAVDDHRLNRHGIAGLIATQSDLRGHSSVATSLRYAHLAPEQRREAHVVCGAIEHTVGTQNARTV